MVRAASIEGILTNLKEYRRELEEPIYPTHLLATYAEGTQKYGGEYFIELSGILDYLI